MSNVQVKGVDESTHEKLRERAEASGSTISQYVLELIRRDLRRPTRAQWFDRLHQLEHVDMTTDEILAIRDRGRAER